MEKQFQIKTKEYVERLRTVGMTIMILWALTSTGLNMPWNIRAFSGLDHLVIEYHALLYFMLFVFLYLSFHILDIILIRSTRVLFLQANAQKYKVTFTTDGLHIHVPCLEESHFVEYSKIKYWGFQGNAFDESFTFFVESKALKATNGRISVYMDSTLRTDMEKACKKYASEIMIKSKKEYLPSMMLTLLEVTNRKEEKTKTKNTVKTRG